MLIITHYARHDLCHNIVKESFFLSENETTVGAPLTFTAVYIVERLV